MLEQEIDKDNEKDKDKEKPKMKVTDEGKSRRREEGEGSQPQTREGGRTPNKPRTNIRVKRQPVKAKRAETRTDKMVKAQ